MNDRLLLVKAITLLYREREHGGNVEQSTELVRQLLTHMRKPNTMVNADFRMNPEVQLNLTLTTMASDDSREPMNKIQLLQQLRLNCGNDTALFESLQSGILKDITDKEAQDAVNKFKAEIQSAIRQQKIKQTFYQFYQSTNRRETDVDWDTIITTAMTELEPMQNSGKDARRHSGIVNETNFYDKESVEKTLLSAREEASAEGVFRLGFQGVAKMTGPELMGLRRGEFVNIGALQHNYKSGLALDFFRHAAMYNTPYMLDETKKPALIRISFENSAENDTALLYQKFMAMEQGILVPLDKVDIKEASKLVSDKLSMNGFHCRMFQIDPSTFTFTNLFELVQSIEDDGYEVQMLNLDYLPMMSKVGCISTHSGSEYRDLYRRVKNYCLRKKITLVTPAQLSPDSKRLLRGGVDNFLRDIANKGYYDSCSTLDQEIDLELYIHIRKMNGSSYLCFQRGKHRKPGTTEEKYLTCAYKFDPILGIPDDIDGPDLSLSRITGSGEGGDGFMEDF